MHSFHRCFSIADLSEDLNISEENENSWDVRLRPSYLDQPKAELDSFIENHISMNWTRFVHAKKPELLSTR